MNKGSSSTRTRIDLVRRAAARSTRGHLRTHPYHPTVRPSEWP